MAGTRTVPPGFVGWVTISLSAFLPVSAAILAAALLAVPATACTGGRRPTRSRLAEPGSPS